MMDKEISSEVLKKRKRKLYLKIGSSTLIVLAICTIIVYLLKSGISSQNMETFVVDTGILEISVGAEGSIVPYYEEILISPISTKILNVYKKSGEDVKIGDTILQLDLSSANIELQSHQNELNIKNLKFQQYKHTALRNLQNLEMQVKIEEMKLKRMAVLLSNEIYLDSIGAGTNDRVRQITLEYEVSKLQFEQLKLQFENTKFSLETDLKIHELEYITEVNRLSVKMKTFGEAQIISPRDATLSWVNENIGVSVSPGVQLAILSDLSRYRIKAEISESFAGRILVNSKVEIRIGKYSLAGYIENIVPLVNSGKITFNISLDDAENELLRPGLKVDVYVVNSIKMDVVRIPNRSFYSGSGEYDLWVVKNKKAEKRKVKLGESSSTYIEVLEGLDVGEEIIVSNMSRFRNKSKLQIQ
jgi:HlyD family secretion protein